MQQQPCQLKYQFTKKLRATLFGEIHIAKENKSGTIVAVKVSRPQERKVSAEDPLEEISVMETIRREEEAEIRENTSPKFDDGRKYVIKLLDTYVQLYKGQECHFNVMEYAEGGDIFEKVLKECVPLGAVKRYFHMIVQGVSYLHKRSVCHLDLSLENVLLTKEDEVKICDFGQSQIGRTLVSSGVRRGKIKYMSPEVFQRAEEYDGHKADVWSLGIILWILITGAFCYDAPMRSDKRFEYLARGKSGIEILLHVTKIDVPDEVVDLFTKILSINPTSRITVLEILQHPWLAEKTLPLSTLSLSPLEGSSSNLSGSPPSCSAVVATSTTEVPEAEEVDPLVETETSPSPSLPEGYGTFLTLDPSSSVSTTSASASSSTSSTTTTITTSISASPISSASFPASCSISSSSASKSVVSSPIFASTTPHHFPPVLLFASSPSSSSTSSAPFSPSIFPPPPPVVEEAPVDEAPSSSTISSRLSSAPTFHVVITRTDSDPSSNPSSFPPSDPTSTFFYGPLKRCKSISERKRRRRRNSLFRYFSEHRKI